MTLELRKVLIYKTQTLFEIFKLFLYISLFCVESKTND
jgi:hypothetical protein